MDFFSQDDTTTSDPTGSFWTKSDDDNQDFSFGVSADGEFDAFGVSNGSPVDFGSPALGSPSGGHFPMSPGQQNGYQSPAHQWQRDFDNQEQNCNYPPVDSQEDEEGARSENQGEVVEGNSGWAASDTETGFEADIRQMTKSCEPADKSDSSFLDMHPRMSKSVEIDVESCRQFLEREELPQNPSSKPRDSRNHAGLSLGRGAPPKKHSKPERATEAKSSLTSEHRKDNASTNGFLEGKSRKRPSYATVKDDRIDFIPRHLDSNWRNSKPEANFDDILETSDRKPNKAARTSSSNSAGDLDLICRQMEHAPNPAPIEKHLEERPQRQPAGSRTPMRKQPTMNLGLNQSSSKSPVTPRTMVPRPPTPPEGRSYDNKPLKVQIEQIRSSSSNFDDILETSDCKPNKAARTSSSNSAGDLDLICRQMEHAPNPAPIEKRLDERPQRQPTGSRTPMRKQPTMNLGLNQSSSKSPVTPRTMVPRPRTPPGGRSYENKPLKVQIEQSQSSFAGQPRGKAGQKSAVSEANGELESMTPAGFLQNMGPQLRDILKSEFLRAQQSKDRQEKIENDLRQLLAIAVKNRDLLANRKAVLISQLDQVLQRLKNP